MSNPIKAHFRGNYKTFYAQYLPTVRRIGGNEYRARCPFPGHEDENPSFNFNNQTGQYCCHGCGRRGDAIHFYAKINDLNTKRDFPKILNGIASDFNIPMESTKKRLIRTYDYTDAQGQTLFQVCRFEPKEFKQRQPDGNGGWIWNLKGLSPVLYRLPEVRKAQEVLIVEGEKDVDNLLALGFTATTCPMGAKKWRPEYNNNLKGKHVVLIPDNDNEGKEHVALVGASLNGTAASLKLLELPGLPSKGDVSDWIATFADKTEAAEKLSVMVENAKPYDPPQRVTLEDAVLDSLDFKALDLPEKRIFLHPWLTEQSITLISGWRGTGKTWLALGLLQAITTGWPFGPWEVQNTAPCLLVDGEMPTSDLRERLRDIGYTPNPENPLFIYCDSFANSLGLPRAHLAHESWRASMKRILTTRKIKVVVLDNIASLASGLDENSKKDWDPINQWLLELRFAGISTIMLHHVGKEGKQRGTSAREDNIDNSLILKRPHDYTPEDGCRFVLHFDKNRVSHEHSTLLADYEFRLTQNEHGQLVWAFGSVRKERRKEIFSLLDGGLSQKDIADTLEIDKGYVSRIKKQAIEAGQLSKHGKLTDEGRLYVDG